MWQKNNNKYHIKVTIKLYGGSYTLAQVWRPAPVIDELGGKGRGEIILLSIPKAFGMLSGCLGCQVVQRINGLLIKQLRSFVHSGGRSAAHTKAQCFFG
jgi:hypothetical protein